MARVLITGARGFIGRHLATDLAAAGHDVVGLGHGTWPESESMRSGIKAWVNGDVVPANLRRLCQMTGSPEIVYHLAGGSSVGTAFDNPREDFFRTVVSTAELLDWLRLEAPGSRVVAISSAAVYGNGHSGPIDEKSLPAPFSQYGYHKLLMEQLCESYARNYALDVTIARLFSVYGTQLRKQLLWDLCTKLSRGTPEIVLGGTGNEMRDWMDVRDVAHALRLLGAARWESACPINIGTGMATSVSEVARTVIRHWPRSQVGTRTPRFSGEVRVGNPFSLVASTKRLDVLGFVPRHMLDASLGEYVHWFCGAASATS